MVRKVGGVFFLIFLLRNEGVILVNVKKLIFRALLMPLFFIASWLYYPFCSNGPSLCLWKYIFAVECMGCGLTRAACLFSHGYFKQAVSMNWIIIPVILVVFGVSFNAFKMLLMNLRANCKVRPS